MSNNMSKQGTEMLKVVDLLKQQARYDDALELMSQFCDAARPALGERSFSYAVLLEKVADLNRLKVNLSGLWQ
jgi:hypothetical protein